MIAKIFKLNQGVLAITLHDSLHKLINEGIVSFASNTLMSEKQKEKSKTVPLAYYRTQPFFGPGQILGI